MDASGDTSGDTCGCAAPVSMDVSPDMCGCAPPACTLASVALTSLIAGAASSPPDIQLPSKWPDDSATAPDAAPTAEQHAMHRFQRAFQKIFQLHVDDPSSIWTFATDVSLLAQHWEAQLKDTQLRAKLPGMSRAAAQARLQRLQGQLEPDVFTLQPADSEEHTILLNTVCRLATPSGRQGLIAEIDAEQQTAMASIEDMPYAHKSCSNSTRMLPSSNSSQPLKHCTPTPQAALAITLSKMTWSSLQRCSGATCLAAVTCFRTSPSGHTQLIRARQVDR